MKAWSQPWSQAFLAETLETGYKNRDVSQRHALFCDESLEKIDAKDGILSLESVDYFGTNEYFSENFFGEAINWSGVVSFHCMQVGLVISMRFFSVIIEMTRHVHHVFGLWH